MNIFSNSQTFHHKLEILRSESWMTPELKALNAMGGWNKLYNHYATHHALSAKVSQCLLVISQYVTRQCVYEQVKAEIR